MNYYEELGIRSDADEEEIRKAHRRLVKLMHPDQHRDQALKQLAETQMRRLNSIVSTLLDPEERREYDEELRGGDALSALPQQSSWRSIPWWIASTLGAIVLTVAAVWFFADHIGSSFSSRSNPPQLENLGTPDKDKTDVTVRVPSEAPAKTANPVDTNPLSRPEESRDVQKGGTADVPIPSPKRADGKVAESFPPAAAPAKVTPLPPTKSIPPPMPAGAKRADKAPRDQRTIAHSKAPVAVTPTKSRQPPSVETARKLGEVPVVTVHAPKDQTLDAGLRPPPALANAAAAPGIDIPPSPGTVPPPVRTPRSRDPVEGEWVYAPTEPEKRKPGFYAPEFIQLKLKKDTTGMRGEYSARYNVADNRPVSPDVNFVLKAVDDKALKYVWTSANGSHGWFVIRQLEPDTMRLEWRATASHGGPALTSGMATLVRKN